MIDLAPLFAEFRTRIPDEHPEWRAVVDRLQTDGRMQVVWDGIAREVAPGYAMQVLEAVIAAYHKTEYFPKYAANEKRRAARHKKVAEAIATLSEFFAIYPDRLYPEIPKVKQSLAWASEFSSAQNDAIVMEFRNDLPATRKKNSRATTFCKVLCQGMQDRFGQPLYRVVGILAAVVFEIRGDGIAEGTVKSGWREEKKAKAKVRKRIEQGG